MLRTFFCLDTKEAKNQGFREIPCFLRLAPLDEGNSHCVLKHPSSLLSAQLENRRNFSIGRVWQFQRFRSSS